MDPLNSQFVKELQDGWDQYMDTNEQKHFYFNIELGKSDFHIGSCRKCKVENLNIIDNDGYCKRCAHNLQPQVKVQNHTQIDLPQSLQQSDQSKVLSILQIQEARKNEQEQAFKAKDLKTNNKQALDKLLSDLSSQNQKTQEDIMNAQIKPEFPDNFQADCNKKRPSSHSARRVFSDVLKSDPMDPTMGAGKKTDVLASMSKAADETAEVNQTQISKGSLFQQRPYANPRKVLQTMQQKKNMF